MKPLLILTLIVLTGCNPFAKEKGQLDYSEETADRPTVQRPDPEPRRDSRVDELQQRINDLEEQIRFEKEKKEAWDRIVHEAREDFESIRKIVKKSCFTCHDSDTPIPWYANLWADRNVVRRHITEGRRQLDFFQRFPLVAEGNPNQLSLLKAMKTAIEDKTMPLKIYKTFYPGSRVNKKEKETLMNWIDPLVEKIEAFNVRYERDASDSATARTRKIFEAKCFRCHANGNARGKFGNMEDMEALAESGYVDLENPAGSSLYTIMESGEMPPRATNDLTAEELETVLDWIREVAGRR